MWGEIGGWVDCCEVLGVDDVVLEFEGVGVGVDGGEVDEGVFGLVVFLLVVRGGSDLLVVGFFVGKVGCWWEGDDELDFGGWFRGEDVVMSFV